MDGPKDMGSSPCPFGHTQGQIFKRYLLKIGPCGWPVRCRFPVEVSSHVCFFENPCGARCVMYEGSLASCEKGIYGKIDKNQKQNKIGGIRTNGHRHQPACTIFRSKAVSQSIFHRKIKFRFLGWKMKFRFSLFRYEYINILIYQYNYIFKD